MAETYLDTLRSRAGDSCLGRAELKWRLLESYASDDRRLIFLVGAGGIGKTTLANWLGAAVRERGAAIAWVSGEQIAPNTESFMGGLRVSTTNGPVDLASIGRRKVRDLVVIDSFERLRGMHRWVLGDFLALIGANAMVVIAGRERLPIRERTELGLNDVLVELAVEPMSNADANELVSRFELGEHERAAIIATGHGFPLALRLLAERPAAIASVGDAELSPAVLAALVDAFVSRAPSPAHAAGIYLAAIAQTVDEAMLRAVVDGEADAVFDWLGESAIMERTELGISPHALVRDVVFSHLQQRDPEMLERMQARLIDVLVRRMVSTDVTTAHELLLQAFYARRNAPSVKQHLALELAQRCDVVGLGPQNLREVRELIERFEGSVGLRSFEYWLGRRPLAHVVVGSDGKVKSFEVVIRVPREPGADDLSDPLIATAWRTWRARNPPEPAGDLYLYRWFMESESHQRFTSAMTHLMTIGPLTTVPVHEISQIGFASSPPEQWAPLAPNFQLEWAQDVEVEFNGLRFGFSFGDVNRMKEPYASSGAAVLNTIRAVVYVATGMAAPIVPLLPSLPPAFITREVFGQILRTALNHLNEPQQLRDPGLAALVPVVTRQPIDVTIVDVIVGAIRRLAASPGTARHAEILDATYVRPTAKQHVAAIELGLPYGTYRYQLRKAVAVLEDELWQARESA